MRRWPSPCRAAAPGPRAAWLATCFCLSNSARRRAISSGDMRAMFWKSSFQSGLLLQAKRRLHGGARGGRGLQHLQGKLQREGLRLRVLGPPCGIAEREVGEQQPRHADVLDDVLGATHHHGGDAGRLQRTRGEADALVADGAVGEEQRRIDAIGLAARHQLRAVDLQRHAVAAVGGQPVKARRNRADAPARGRAPQLRQREPGAGVLGRGVLAVDPHMRDAQIVVLRRVAGVDLVELRRRVVRRAQAPDRPCRADRAPPW